jgi:hypothetical protein
MAHSQERPQKGTNSFEKLLATLGLLVAAATAWFIYEQFDTMKRQLLLDQRAWITVVNSEIRVSTDPIERSARIFVPVTVQNIGKTPATRIFVRFQVEKVPSGGVPAFRFERPGINMTSGIVFPNGHFEFEGFMSEVDQKGVATQARVLSSSEMQELYDGKAYLVSYSSTTYVDIFGVSHWTKACYYTPVTTASRQYYFPAPECIRYNAVDSN